MFDLRRPLIALMFVPAAASAAIAARAGSSRSWRRRTIRSPRATDSKAAAEHESGPGVLSLLPGDAVTEHSIDRQIRQARLYGDRRNVLAVRSIGRTLGRKFLHGLCREDRHSGGAAGDFCLQRRPGRRVGIPQSRTCRSAHRRIRHERPRRLASPPDRQSRYLARLHRSGADRSGRHRLEPAGQARWRPSVLERARRRRIHGQSRRALCREKQPRQFAEIHPRRKLWRLSRRQGRARAAERSGHRGFRDPDGIADARRRIPIRRRPLRARRRAAIAVACRGRARAQRRLQQGGAGAGRAFRAHRLSHHACRSAAAGRRGQEFLCARRKHHRPVRWMP